jgi:hypothetical protein
MASLDDFLQQFSDRFKKDEIESAPGAVLTVILLGASDTEVRFSHLGVIFRVKRSDVLSVE